MKNWLINKVLKSKKFWYAVGGILIPVIADKLGMPIADVKEFYYMIVALIIGQGIADNAIYKKKDPHY